MSLKGLFKAANWWRDFTNALILDALSVSVACGWNLVSCLGRILLQEMESERFSGRVSHEGVGQLTAKLSYTRLLSVFPHGLKGDREVYQSHVAPLIPSGDGVDSRRKTDVKIR